MANENVSEIEVYVKITDSFGDVKRESQKGFKIKGPCCDKLLGNDLTNSISFLNFVPDDTDE